VRRPVLIGGIAAVLVVVLAVVVACSMQGSDQKTAPPTATSTGSPTPDPTAQGMTREQLQDAVFNGDVGSSTVLGQADGKVPDRTKDLPAHIDVTEVTASATSTLVRFTLKNAKDGQADLSLEAFNQRTPLTRDIRDVAIVDPVGQQRYQPYVGVSSTDKDVTVCACSSAPVVMTSTGQLLSATFPPVDAEATTISLVVPGFPEIKGLPVTRR